MRQKKKAKPYECGLIMDSEVAINESYEFYLENFCRRLKLPYNMFALCIGFYVPILIIILVPAEREKYLNWVLNQFGFLWFVTVFLILIMMKRLRDKSVKILLNISYKSGETKKEISEYLKMIFAPDKLENVNNPK